MNDKLSDSLLSFSEEDLNNLEDLVSKLEGQELNDRVKKLIETNTLFRAYNEYDNLVSRYINILSPTDTAKITIAKELTEANLNLLRAIKNHSNEEDRKTLEVLIESAEFVLKVGGKLR